jgi:hypothetical protein
MLNYISWKVRSFRTAVAGYRTAFNERDVDVNLSKIKSQKQSYVTADSQYQPFRLGVKIFLGFITRYMSTFKIDIITVLWCSFWGRIRSVFGEKSQSASVTHIYTVTVLLRMYIFTAFKHWLQYSLQRWPPSYWAFAFTGTVLMTWIVDCFTATIYV